MKEAKKIPAAPPHRPRRRASIRKERSMLLRRKPSALKVPISPILFATAAYMVIIAPMIAPREKIKVNDMPSMRRNFAIISDCSR
jgi:hypothetical protein